MGGRKAIAGWELCVSSWRPKVEKNKANNIMLVLKNNTERVIFYSFLVIIAGILVLLIMSSSNNSSPQPLSQEQPKGPSMGEKGVLRVPGQTEVLVASSKENLDKITHAAVVKDNLGIAQMVLASEAFFVDAETKVLVINTSFATREVRILEGKKFGSSGWVPFEFVVSQ